MKYCRAYVILFWMVMLFQACETQTNQADFQLCGDGKLWPYYHPDLTNKESFYKIKNRFLDQYKVVPGKKLSGFVKIRFHVNCHGESGNFTVENYSLNYKKITLEPMINAQLLQITQEIKGWIPGKDDQGETVNSHKFYLFRIEDGHITDILPK